MSKMDINSLLGTKGIGLLDLFGTSDGTLANTILNTLDSIANNINPESLQSIIDDYIKIDEIIQINDLTSNFKISDELAEVSSGLDFDSIEQTIN